jgi:cell filamentation protein
MLHRVSAEMSGMSGRYSAHGPEAETEPGSRGRVLRNRLGITSVREMERRESAALLAATQGMIDETQADQTFVAGDIRRMHEMWLGEIYAWAGEYRQVNLGKGSFMFAAAAQVPRLMQQFEEGPLREYTPCLFGTLEEQAKALAVVHAELILIHPFRDGNGRCARLLAMLMGLQAGLPALDFGGIRRDEKRRYIGAVHAALGRDYAPMILIFRRIIERTLRSGASA